MGAKGINPEEPNCEDLTTAVCACNNECSSDGMCKSALLAGAQCVKDEYFEKLECGAFTCDEPVSDFEGAALA